MKIYKVKVNGKVYEVELEAVTEQAGTVKAEAKEEVKEVSQPVSAEGTTVKAPMQGTIIKINVNVGDTVKKGQPVCVLEAMKLENDIVATADGKVVAIKVTKGQTVNNGDALVILG